MSVLNNTASLTAQRNIQINQKNLDDTVGRVSSGKRIDKVSADSAGFAVAKRISADINTLGQAMRNASQAASLAQVATGAMSQVSEALQRMKTLSTQVISGALSDTERSYADAEYQKLVSQIDNIATQTLFNGTALVNGGSSTVTTTTETVQKAIVNAGDDTTIFNDELVAGSSMGYIEGRVTNVSVKAMDDNVFSMNLKVGEQTFSATYSPIANTASTVQFVSTSDSNNIIGLSWKDSVAAGVTASQIQTDLETLFGTKNGNNASINMAHEAPAFVSNVTAPTGGVSGVWLVQGSGTNFTATDGVSVYNAEAKSASGAQSVTFSNGISLNLGATYDAGASGTSTVDNYRVMIAAGDNQTLNFQVGQKATDTISMKLYSVSSSALNIADTKVSDASSAAKASAAIDAAITTLNTNMALVGAVQSQFEISMANTAVMVENLTAARGAIEDANLAEEMTNLAKRTTLGQMGHAMLAQANQMSQHALRLFS